MSGILVRLVIPLALVTAPLAIAQHSDAQRAPRPGLVLVCAPCHGFDGIGRDGKTPNLAGQKRDYLQGQMLAFRSGKRRHPAMDFFSGQVNREELNQLLDYYAALPLR